jgi:hypothetical protein
MPTCGNFLFGCLIMARTWAVAVFMLGVSGCAALPDWALFTSGRAAAPRDQAGHYDFAWRLSGDRAIAPAQVFDDGRQMWLQFATAQTLPALFARSPRGDRPLSYRRQGPYVVLPGVWPHLVLRGGHLESFIDRVDPVSVQKPQPALPPAVQAAAPGDRGPGSPAAAASPVDARFTANSFAVALEPFASAPPSAGSDAMGPQPAPRTVTPPQLYEVSPQDGNIREALSRWARLAGWTFKPEHWAVDADIPIAGSARFDSEFTRAVQDLIASTELADRPLRPCFYSNKVLRIVPYAQSCDRTAGLAEPS